MFTSATPSSSTPSARAYSVTFLGGGQIVSRLPEIIKRPGVHVTVVGREGNPLATSQFVDDFVILEQEGDESWSQAIIRQAELILQLKSDWYIVENDVVAYDLAQSNLNLNQKLTLLPTRLEKGLAVIGSKIGLAKVASSLELAFPKTTIAENLDELMQLAELWPGSGFIKSDLGGGGWWVKYFTSLNHERAREISNTWFPVLVQEEIPGIEISVEVLFRRGRVAGWMYSQPTVTAKNFGPSVRRTYVEPPSLDFIDTLSHLSQELSLHGFFNCSFIWNKEIQQHVLFEADPRPNPWHQFGPQLGVDWIEIMTTETKDFVSRPSLSRRKKLGLYPRVFIFFGLEKKFSLIFPWLFGMPGTWATRNRNDRAINKMEDDIVLTALGIKSRLSSFRRFFARF